MLQQALDALHEHRRVMAVDDAVIETRRQVHHLAHDHLAVLDHHALGDLVGADDGDLGVVDDGGVDHPAQGAQRGDGDGRARQFVALGAAVFGRARDAGDLQRRIPWVKGFGVADHRDHQAVRRLGGDAEVDGGVGGQDASLIIVVGVDGRLVAQGHDDGTGDEGQDVEFRLVLLPRRIEVGAEFLEGGDVDLFHIGDVGDAADALGHLLRDLAAQTDDAGFGGAFVTLVGGRG